MRLTRYTRLIGIFTAASVSAQLEYRATFIISVLNAILTAGGALFGLVVLVGDGSAIGGWSYYEAIVVIGLFTLVQGFIAGFLLPNLNKIAEDIRLGTMDFTLLKPIDAQFYVSTRNINIFPLGNILIGLVVIGWALTHIPSVTVAGMLVGAVLIAAALATVYAIWFMLTTTSFWFVKVSNATELFNGLLRAGQFPVSVFPAWLRVLFTVIIPIAFITTVPAEALVGRINATSACAAIIVAALFALISRWFWRRAVGSYTSASS